MSDVGGRKERVQLINDNLNQNNRRGKVIAQRYNIVIIPRADPTE